MSLPPRIAKIVLEVAEKHVLTPDQITGPDRRRAPSRARYEAYQRIRDEIVIANAPPSLPRIGTWFNNRDHTSVLYGLGVHARESAQ